jgi:predicted transcriptional regulator
MGGVTISKIQYKTFLGHKQLKEYLAMLVERGLVDYDKINSEFRTTEKGTRFLKLYEKLGQMWRMPK